jgi:hypothetical protein
LVNKFDSKTVAAMRSVLEEACSHIPPSASSARTFVASRILECASTGEETYDGLLAAARRAILDQDRNGVASAGFQ